MQHNNTMQHNNATTMQHNNTTLQHYDRTMRAWHQHLTAKGIQAMQQGAKFKITTNKIDLRAQNAQICTKLWAIPHIIEVLWFLKKCIKDDCTTRHRVTHFPHWVIAFFINTSMHSLELTLALVAHQHHDHFAHLTVYTLCTVHIVHPPLHKLCFLCCKLSSARGLEADISACGVCQSWECPPQCPQSGACPQCPPQCPQWAHSVACPQWAHLPSTQFLRPTLPARV